MSDVLREIAFTAVAPELEKIETVIQQNIPDQVVAVCKQLHRYLKQAVDKVQDKPDLAVLRANLDTISIFITLVLDSSPEQSSWWAEPLIRECYELCQITGKRDVLIIHSRDTSLDEFGVYQNILEDTLASILILEPNVSSESKPLDIFVIPAEVKFDISLVALVGHEVGHVYWQLNHNLLEEKITEKSKELGDPDLFNYEERKQKGERVARHIEEYLCDQVGRYLLGPAFDFALLRLFYSLPDNGMSGKTHPPIERRLNLSRVRLEKYVEKGHVIADFLGVMHANLLSQSQNTYLDEYDKMAEEAAQEIYNSSNLKIEARFSPEKLEKIWLGVHPELDGFRPPFEVVSVEKPTAISPTDAIVATTIYFYGDAYKASNQFYIDNSLPEIKKREILRAKLIEHLRYSISLNDFVKHSHKRISNFDTWQKKDTLWNWREREDGGKPNAFIVVPTLDCSSQYGQNTVDLRLGSSFLINIPSRYTHIEPAPGGRPLSAYYQKVHVAIGKDFILHPHQFILACILEYICLPYDYYGLVLGRSTWGRLGLNIATATTVQAGYRGCLTLELRNLGESPLPLTVGTRIAQLCLIPIPNVNTGKGYFKSGGKYIGPVEVGIPQIHNDPDWNLLESFAKGQEN
jgi:dCTP deaminase